MPQAQPRQPLQRLHHLNGPAAWIDDHNRGRNLVTDKFDVLGHCVLASPRTGSRIGLAPGGAIDTLALPQVWVSVGETWTGGAGLRYASLEGRSGAMLIPLEKASWRQRHRGGKAHSLRRETASGQGPPGQERFPFRGLVDSRLTAFGRVGRFGWRGRTARRREKLRSWVSTWEVRRAEGALDASG